MLQRALDLQVDQVLHVDVELAVGQCPALLEVGGEDALELLQGALVDLLQPLATGVVERRTAHLVEHGAHHRGDPRTAARDGRADLVHGPVGLLGSAHASLRLVPLPRDSRVATPLVTLWGVANRTSSGHVPRTRPRAVRLPSGAARGPRMSVACQRIRGAMAFALVGNASGHASRSASTTKPGANGRCR